MRKLYILAFSLFLIVVLSNITFSQLGVRCDYLYTLYMNSPKFNRVISEKHLDAYSYFILAFVNENFTYEHNFSPPEVIETTIELEINTTEKFFGSYDKLRVFTINISNEMEETYYYIDPYEFGVESTKIYIRAKLIFCIIDNNNKSIYASIIQVAFRPIVNFSNLFYSFEKTFINTTFFAISNIAYTYKEYYSIQGMISAGYYHTCALLQNGSVYCWGDNIDGQSEDYYGGDAIQISAGDYHTCALLRNGSVYCWGYNRYGQSDPYYGGDAISVSAGGMLSCIKTSNNTLYCQGNFNNYKDYIVFEHDILQFSVGTAHVCTLLQNGNVYCWGNNWYGQSNPYLGNDAISVSAGGYHTCALLRNGNVYCWGNNWYGQSNPYLGNDAIQISAGYYHTCALLQNGSVYCWGDNWYGQSNPYLGNDAIQISAGRWHTCALLRNGSVYCWGDNSYGQSNPYYVLQNITYSKHDYVNLTQNIFFLKLKKYGGIYFKFNGTDEFFRLCMFRELGLTYINIECPDEILNNYTRENYLEPYLGLIRFVFYVNKTNETKLYIKHEEWNDYRELDPNDPLVKEYFYIGSLAPYDVNNKTFILFPIENISYYVKRIQKQLEFIGDLEEWHSDNHAGRIKIYITYKLPLNFKLRYGYMYNRTLDEIDVTIPILLNTKSMLTYDCSELRIFTFRPMDKGVYESYFFVDDRKEYTCGSELTQIFIRTTAVYDRIDIEEQAVYYKSLIYVYFFPRFKFNNSYYNVFDEVFKNYFYIEYFFNSETEYYFLEDSTQLKLLNYIMPINIPKISNIQTFFYSENYIPFIIKPKKPGYVSFKANITDNGFTNLRMCELSPLYYPTTTVLCRKEIFYKDYWTESLESTIYLDSTSPMLLAVEEYSYPPNIINIYIKHEEWNDYRELDPNDPLVKEYFYIGSLAPYDVDSKVFVGFPIIQQEISAAVNYNYSLMFNDYEYLTTFIIPYENSGYIAGFGIDTFNYEFNIDTKNLIREGKLDNECKNILFYTINNYTKEIFILPYWFDKDLCDTSHTHVFIRVPITRPVIIGADTYVYMLTSKNRGNLISTKFNNPDITFDKFIDFNSIDDVFKWFNVTGAYCNGVRYFDVIDGKLYIYGSPCGTEIYRSIISKFSTLKTLKFKILTNDINIDEILRFAIMNEVFIRGTSGELFSVKLFSVHMLNYDPLYKKIKHELHITLDNRSVTQEIYNIQPDKYYILVYNGTSEIRCSCSPFARIDTIHIIDREHDRTIISPFSMENLITEYCNIFLYYIFGKLNNFTLVIDYVAEGTYTFLNRPQPPPCEFGLYQDVNIRVLDENNNEISTEICIKDDLGNELGCRLTPTTFTLLNYRHYTYDLKVPENYAFIVWEIVKGTIFIRRYDTYGSFFLLCNDTIIGRVRKIEITPPPPPQPRVYFMAIDATRGINLSVRIYLDGGFADTPFVGVYERGERYILSASIPTDYTFINWTSVRGNTTIQNPYSLTTDVFFNGDDIIILYLNYTPITPIPEILYDVNCRVIDLRTGYILPSLLIILKNEKTYLCDAFTGIRIPEGIYTLDTQVPHNCEFRYYVSDFVISNISDINSSVIIDRNGNIYAYIYCEPLPEEPDYNITFLVFDQFRRSVNTSIYLNGVGYESGKSYLIKRGNYELSAFIPEFYSFINWTSVRGNVLIRNISNITTEIIINGDDTIILYLNLTYIRHYNVTCYIETVTNKPVLTATIYIGNANCINGRTITIPGGEHKLSINYPKECVFITYSSDFKISNLATQNTTIEVYKNGYVKALLNCLEYVHVNISRLTEGYRERPIVYDVFSYSNLMIIILILIIGGILSALGNLPIGLSFIICAILFTFLPKDAVGFFVIGISAILTYFIAKIFIKL